MKRSRINPVSKKRRAENVVRRENLERAWGPRPWSCWLAGKVGTLGIPPCYGEVNGHEIVKASQGGSRTDPANLLPLCNLHNDWVETADRSLVYDLGLVRSNWE